MNLHKPVHIKKWLIPISWLYGLGVSIRNRFFKWGIFKQKEYGIPIICVGNISVGGTGKTPHTEYLIRLLKDRYRIAVLSRGYKRKTNGYILSTVDSSSREIGDEPYQMKQKYPNIVLAVDKKRVRGIEKLLALKTPPEVIILDDGFQHRHVKPSYSIVLSDFNRPVYEDKLLPAGRLRESIRNLDCATEIIVTKCPSTLQPIDFRLISRDFNLFPFQGLFFTNFVYRKLEPVFNSGRLEKLDLSSLKHKHVLAVTGIAFPKPFIEEISQYAKVVESIEYGDHHTFSNKNIRYIISRFKKIKTDDKIIVVTEKDASRLKALEIDESLKFYFYCIPVEVNFLDETLQADFDKRIINHVEENKRNNKLR